MVTNIAAYHFAAVDDPDALAGRLRERAEACALLGTVLVAGEGINLLLAGTDNAIEDFLQELRADPRFAGLQAKYSRSAAPPLARLKVKVKPQNIGFRSTDAAPLGGRAPAVAPAAQDVCEEQGQAGEIGQRDR